jgi:pimeloyl-ACP methyl ester carboxylesterase
MESREIDLGGAVRVESYGESGPAMVLVHGLGGSLLNWRAVAPLLAGSFSVRALDLRGHGRSAMPGGSTIDENLALLTTFLEREVGRSATLVGNSMGGLLSLRLAAARPDLVERLVLVNPAMPWTYASRVDPLVATFFGMYAVPGLGELYLERVVGGVPAEKAVREMMKLCGVAPSAMDPAVLQAHVDLARERYATMPYRNRAFLSAAWSTMRALLSRGAYAHQVHRVQAPTLLIHGDRDRLVPVGCARAVAALRPDWTYHELADTGHTPMLQSPDDFAARVAAFAGA